MSQNLPVMNETPLSPGIYPFWFWNGKENQNEIDRQLRLAATAGLDGMAIHSRTGNQIPYLSDLWFDLVRHACITARELGLKIWIYDEDGYPSGTAGNRIQKCQPELRQEYLTFNYATAAACRKMTGTIFCFRTSDYLRIDPSTLPEAEEVLYFRVEKLDCYVDTLNPQTAKLFIDFTHELYYQHLKEFFGNTITAIYTDDINSKMILASGLPWSPVLTAEYSRRFGTSLEDQLPWLVESLPGGDNIRIRYRRLIQQLFRNNFIVPMADWSRQHGVIFTGHFSGDEGPLTRMISETGSLMPLMTAEHIPGVDDYLTVMKDGRYLARPQNHLGLYPLPLFLAGAAIARQFGNNRYSCECLAGLGWDFSMELQDRQILFEIAMGINLFTPHAAYYTVGGPGKKDHPPSLFFQQPYWKSWSTMAKKWGRSAELLLRGNYSAATMVLYPASATWASQSGNHIIPSFTPRRPNPGTEPATLEAQFAALLLLLMQQKIGFELGDEIVVTENAVIEGNKLRLGARTYDTIIIPPSAKVLQETDDLFTAMQQAGGKIIDLRSGIPSRIDLPPVVELSSPDNEDLSEIMVHARDNNDFTELFLLNLSPEDKKITLHPSKEFCIYDAMEDQIVWNDTIWPKDFVLPAWNCCHVLPVNFAEQKNSTPFAATRFKSSSGNQHLPLSFRSARRNCLNTVILSPASADGKTFELLVTEKVHIHSIMGEGILKGPIYWNNRPLPRNKEVSHPCDAAYQGYELDLDLAPGQYRIELENCHDLLYLNGDFSVAINENQTTLSRPSPIKTGNLALNGMPFYWGQVIYEFTIELTEVSPSSRLNFNQVEGVIDVTINNHPPKTLTGTPYSWFAASFLQTGTNIIRVELSNTAQNFIAPFDDGKLAQSSFGIFGPVEILTE